MERYDEIYDRQGLVEDEGLAARATEGQTEQNMVKKVLFDAKDVVLGGFNLLREHPLGSIEVGSAIAAAGAVAGALVVPRLRHS